MKGFTSVDGMSLKRRMLGGQPRRVQSVAFGGNCTRSPFSTSSFGGNNLRFSPLSLAAPQQRDPGINLHDLAVVDPRLARLCAAWASLPEHVILAILALVNSAGVVAADRLQPPSRVSQGHDARGGRSGIDWSQGFGEGPDEGL